MLVLGFDTSTPAITVAVGDVCDDGLTVLGSSTEVAENRHGELLAPAVDRVLRAAGVAITDLATIAVGIGPGPFTGLRVGIVTAKALSDSLGIPAYGESSLRLLTGGAAVGIATNARRRQVYWAIPDELGFAAAPDIAEPGVAAAAFRDAGVTSVAGEGSRLYPEAFAGLSVVAECVYPSAARLLALVSARARAGAPGEPLEPLYLRRPDAAPPGRPKRVTPA